MLDLESFESGLKAFVRKLPAGAAQVALTTYAEEVGRTYFSKMTKEEMSADPTVKSLLTTILAAIPGKATRRHFLEGLEAIVRANRLTHDTLLGAAIVGILEGADDGIRELMEREDIKQADAMKALGRMLPKIKDKVSTTHTTPGDTVDHSHDHGHTAPKPTSVPTAATPDANLKFMKELTPEELRAFETMLAEVMAEIDGDPTDRDLVGWAFKADNGGNLILEFEPTVIKEHLPKSNNGESEETYLRRLASTDMRVTRLAFFRTLRRAHSINNRNKPFNVANVRDWIDLLVPMAWIKEQLQLLSENKETSVHPRLSRVFDTVKVVAMWVLGVHGGIAAWAVAMFGAFAILFLGGATTIVALAFQPFPLLALRIMAGVLMVIGLVGIFGMRLALRPLDDIWTAALDILAAPIRLIRLGMHEAGIGDKPGARVLGNGVETVKDRSTIVTSVAFALALVMVVFDFNAYMGAYLWRGMYDLMCISHAAALTLTAIFPLAFGLFGENGVRISMGMLDTPPAGADAEYKTRFEKLREFRMKDRLLVKKITGGVLMATVATLVLATLTQSVFGFGRRGVEYAMEYSTATKTQHCDEVKEERLATSQQYAIARVSSGEQYNIGLYCVRHDEDPVCQECWD